MPKVAYASHVSVDLKSSQVQSLTEANRDETTWTVVLSRKQVADSVPIVSSTEAKDIRPFKLMLNKLQTKSYDKARANKTGLRLVFNKITVRRIIRKGGFFGAIIPALAAMLPGLLGSAPQILDGVKSGYETVGKLFGIKKGKDISLDNVLDQVLEERGSSLMNFGAGEKEGQSLMNFGESLHNFGPVVARKTRKAPVKKTAKNE